MNSMGFHTAAVPAYLILVSDCDSENRSSHSLAFRNNGVVPRLGEGRSQATALTDDDQVEQCHALSDRVVSLSGLEVDVR